MALSLEAWQALPWRRRLSLMRSGLQKAARRGDQALALQCARLYVHDGKPAAVLKNLLLFAVEDMSASPELLLQLVVRIEALQRGARSAPALAAKQQQIYQLVEWVADPRWPRSRQLPLLACRVLQAIEEEEELPLPVLREWVELDRLYVSAPKEWKAAALRVLPDRRLQAAFRQLEHRLVVGFGLLWRRGLLPSPVVVPLPPLRSEVPPVIVPAWPEWVLDKHTPEGRKQQRGIAHFLEEGASVVQEMPPSAELQPFVAAGRQRYFELEAAFGTKKANSRAVVARLKRRAASPSAASPKKPRGDLQAQMRAQLEPLMPLPLRGQPWAQPLTSSRKRPVIVLGSEVWKGPFPLDWERRALLEERQAAMERAGVCVPRGAWQEHLGHLWWVMERLALQPLAEASFPAGPAAIAQLVAAGVAKIALGIGDRALRNVQWDAARQCVVAIDFEDSPVHPVDLGACEPLEWCFQSRKVGASFKQRLFRLMQEHREACAAAVDALHLPAAQIVAQRLLSLSNK